MPENPKSPFTGAPRAAAARKPSWTWPRTSSAWSRSRGHRPLAGGDGFQEEARRGDAGQVHCRHAAQRRDPHRASRRRWRICSGARASASIAYGACAQLGGIPSLANQFSREQTSPLRVRPGAHGGQRGEDAAAASSQNNGHTRRRCRNFATSSARSTRLWTWTTTSPAARPRPK